MAMEDGRKEIEQLEREIADVLRLIRPQLRAELLIRGYCNLENPGARLSACFEQWLEQNAETVLQTDALEEYFRKSLPAAPPERNTTEPTDTPST